LERRDGRVEEIAGKATLAIETGDRLLVETPGGGGFGPAK
jgi:5-oxoprolinase (ATP-hydrolysing)